MKALRIALVFCAVILMLTIYALLHAVIGIYFIESYGLNISWLLWILGVSSIICLFLAKWKRNLFTTVYYIIGTTWMGILFIASLIIVPVLTVSTIANTRLYPQIVLPVIFFLVLLGIYNGRATQVRRVIIELKVKRPLKLVQLTDLHIGEIYGPGFLKRIVKTANEQKPDVVVITGDLFDGGGKLYEGIIAELKGIKQPAFFITGNHEIYEGAEKTKRLVSSLGVKVLDDEIVSIKSLQLAGLGYQENFTDDKKAALRALAKKRSNKTPCVLLRHEPKDIELAAKLGFDVMLSGHTHNGQMWPLNYLVSLTYGFSVGLHEIGSMVLYISPGAGTWGPALRLGSRSEITVLEMVPSLPERKSNTSF